jgi:diadenosine tetraphosphate (Ap4A) HIT family hydrolase
MIQKDLDCLYCSRNLLQQELMIEICDLPTSTLFLFKEQSYKGRCVIAYKDHVNELFELNESERAAFIEDVNLVAKSLKAAFSPAKINMGAYSDKLKHLHFHIVPKYENGVDFGGTFQMNPKAVYLSDAQYNELIQQIKDSIDRLK